MTNMSIGKFVPALKLKLGTKAVICAILLIAMNTALVVGAGYWSLTSEFNQRAYRDIEVNLRTLALAFAEAFPEAKISISNGALAKAEIAKMPEFRDHTIVDRQVSYTGGNATLFVYDDASNQFVRRTTNVKKENGDRAVGTQLAPDHPGQAVLRKGQAYKGPAVLFGKSFMTAYYPVVNASGKVVGIIYVGIAMAEFESMLAQAMQTMAIAAGIAALLVMILTMLIVRRITKPLTSVTASLTAIAEGKSDLAIDCEDRHDEIGEIARTVAVFKNNAQERQRMRNEQAAAAAAASEQRKAELRHFVDDFQTGVGGIIDKVMSSSGEFERIARQLTETARTTAELSGKSASASETASEHVRSRGCRLRRTVELDRRDHPPRAGVQRHRRRSRPPGRGHRPAHDRAVAGRHADRRRRQADHHHRRTNQSARAQRHHRGGARRRCRPRLCGGRPGGQEPRRPDRQGDRGNLQPDRQHAACDRGVGGRHQGDRQDHRAHQRHRHLDLGGGGAAELGDAKHRPKRPRSCERHGERRGQCRQRRARRRRNRGNLEPDVCAAQDLSGESMHLKAEVEKFLDGVRAA